MNVNRKKAAIKKYGDAYKTNPDETQSQMIAEGYTEEEVFEITEALAEGSESTEPAEAKKPEPKGKGKKADGPKGGLNNRYEKWKVKVTYETSEKTKKLKLDEDGMKIPIFTKVEHLRDVSMSEEQANLLNQYTDNSNPNHIGIHYYKKDN